ncbi:MAG: diguanylate cyclase [Lachnotalea sp.]
MKQNKIQLQEKIESYRYIKVEDEIYSLLDEFIDLCREEHDEDGLVAGYFYKGELFFRLGNYDDATIAIETCLSYKNAEHCKEFQSNAYNVLGLMYAFLGCEIIALEYYLEGLEIARANNIYKIQTIIYINMGWLYKDIRAYDKAMENYNHALTSARSIPKEVYYNLEVLCYAYIGQIYCKKKEYSIALELLNKIYETKKKNNILYYDVSLDNLEISIYDYLNMPDKVQANIEHVLNKAAEEDDFIEFFEFYLDVCNYIIEKGKKDEARRLLDSLHKNASKLNLVFINLKIQAAETQYHKIYSAQVDYLNACAGYMTLQKQYEVFIRKSLLSGMKKIEELRQIEKEKEHFEEISRLDGMTGILNKNAIEYYIKEYLDIYSNTQKAGLILIDIDNFKMINDNFGHSIGDRIIKKVATSITQTFNVTDMIGRVGGDEFLVLMKNVEKKEDVFEKAEELRKTFENNLCEDDITYKLSVSIGISMIINNKYDFRALFNKADEALYEAKNEGRNKVIII